MSEVRGVLNRMFQSAVEAEIIEHNPVVAVRVPKLREVRKQREILTDDEFARCIASPHADLELRMLALTSRCEGGMRTGDLHQWDWSQIDLDDFGECIIPRSKTKAPQRLAIPATFRPFLRAWWERSGEPRSGPVFPARRGKRAGERKSANNSYAKRLRRDLFRAGIHRLPPIRVPAKKPGQRTDLGKKATTTKLAPNPRDPLYYETDATLPVDFHSCRRAFSTALAEAGVNVQHAMQLTAHTDPRVHERHVMSTSAMRSTPEAALPPVTVVVAAADAEDGRNVMARDVSSKRRRVKRDVASEILAPAAGLEPATRRLTEGVPMTQCESLRDDAPPEQSEGDDADASCFTVRQDDSSRNVTDPSDAGDGVVSLGQHLPVTTLAAPSTSGDAVRLAIKLSVDAGEYERAETLLSVLRRTPVTAAAAPIDLARRRNDSCRAG